MTKEDSHCLSHEQARRYYDMLGAKLDTQAFYENVALHELVAHLGLEDCHSLVEFGCGTGRLAENLFKGPLLPEARYLGLDVSSTMVTVTRGRLSRWSDRATVQKSDGTIHIDVPDGSFDRFVCTYVLDLLAEGDIRATISEAYRVLSPDGLLGLVSLTNGQTSISQLVSGIWKGLHTASPWIVGGCRPIVIEDFLQQAQWQIEHIGIISRFGVSSEIVVAKPVQSS